MEGVTNPADICPKGILIKTTSIEKDTQTNIDQTAYQDHAFSIKGRKKGTQRTMTYLMKMTHKSDNLKHLLLWMPFRAGW